MRILLVHNFYGSDGPSGENNVVDGEADLLRRAGHDVELFARRSDALRTSGLTGLLRGGMSTPWNPFAAANIKRATKFFRPDIVHVHNTFPSISPAVFSAVGRRAARVLTLHNYRTFCAQGLFTRDGSICTACLDGRSSLPGLRYRCYRGSRVATLPLSVSIWLHHSIRTWTRRVEAFIALTDYQRDLFERGGFPRERLYVKPNFFAPATPPVAWKDRADNVVYAGRIAAEKGVEVLVDAWLQWGAGAPPLRILGDGPGREPLLRRVAGANARNIQFLGPLARPRLLDEISTAKLLVVPSVGMEGFPMVIQEAFALGTPVAASDAGPLPSIINSGVNGIIFRSGDAAALRASIASAWSDTSAMALMAAGALETCRKMYMPEANLQRLIDIYRAAIGTAKGRS